MPHTRGTRAPTRPSATSTRSRCGRCGRHVLWLSSISTGRRVAVDPYPVPGGDCTVYATEGLFRWEPNAALIDPTRLNPEARPTLHLRHSRTCGNVTVRRLAAEESAVPPVRRSHCGRHLWDRLDRRLATCALAPDHEEPCTP